MKTIEQQKCEISPSENYGSFCKIDILVGKSLYLRS